MRPTRVTVASGSSVVFPVDYFSSTLTVAAYPTGGANATVTMTVDDPQVANPAPTYFALPAPFNVAVTANTIGAIALFPVRALKFATTVSGTCDYVVIQGSGDPADGGAG